MGIFKGVEKWLRPSLVQKETQRYTHIYLLALNNPLFYRPIIDQINSEQKSDGQNVKVIAVEEWNGPRQMSGIKIVNLERRRISHHFERLRSFRSLHPNKIESSEWDRNIRTHPKNLNKLSNLTAHTVTVFVQTESLGLAISSFCSNFLHAEKVIVQVPVLNLSTNNKVEMSTISQHLTSQEKILIIQPDWENCGSAKTFDLVGRLSAKNDMYPVRITSSLALFEGVAQLGLIHANSESEGYSGLSLNATFGSRRKTLLLLIINVATMLFSTKRNSVVELKRRIYSMVSLDKNSLELIVKAAPRIIYVNHFFNLELANKIKKRLHAMGIESTVIIDTHDVQSRNFSEQGYRVPWSYHIPNIEREIESEFELISHTERQIFVSRKEQMEFLDWASRNNFDGFSSDYALPVEYPKIVTETKLEKTPNRKLQLVILMANNAANQASLRWFYKEILPNISDLPIEISIYGDIVKYSTNLSISDLVKFRGKAEILRTIYDNADICLFPVITGNGVAVKALEALQFGVAFVGTGISLRGLPLHNHNLERNTAEEFIEDLRDLVYSSESLEERKCISVQIAQGLLANSYEAKFPNWILRSEH